MSELQPSCPLCAEDGGAVVYRHAEYRVVLVDDADHPGFCRVICNDHVREMTDLAPDRMARLMGAVFAVEDAVRSVLAPLKVNLASLGNMVPHVHWHVIPRHADDPQFPNPIWGERLREPDAAQLAVRRALLAVLADEIRSRLPAAAPARS